MRVLEKIQHTHFFCNRLPNRANSSLDCSIFWNSTARLPGENPDSASGKYPAEK
jgi:hypothetical protein